ncbi:MAG: bifunctional dihydroorotate dehydrogenase B NAD binding subunit/NADPH-dependent glutamate synthase [Bacteroidales bacterium]|jgi:glutamate synthase (NADPH/NADH) small chain|nr:bifunctional dihydroorotate dehydrogenase B NAD binding subunit/NADPH-dependent glutamate synthase [Bacteroidales bacterium]
MYKILSKQLLAPAIVEMAVYAPRIAKSGQPGQFLIVKTDEQGERIPLTICDLDKEKGSVTIVFQIVGKSTEIMAALNPGDYFHNFTGPLGKASEWITLSDEELRKENILFIAGGVGTAPVYPQVKWLHSKGIACDVLIGVRSKDFLIYHDKMKAIARQVYVSGDDGSIGFAGKVTDALVDLIDNQGKKYTHIVTIGPMIMMKFVTLTAKSYNIPVTVSLNSLMVDGTGMCGACRVTVGGKTKFTCVDGPEFNGYEVDFEEAMRRQAMYSGIEDKVEREEIEHADGHSCFVGGVSHEQPDRKKAIPVREQDPKVRITNFAEVCHGYNEEEAVMEAKRCLQCKNAPCVGGCPVSIHIPLFIKHIASGDFDLAAQTLNESSMLPAVCGRVCPQESQCEGVCVLGKKGDPVSIGKLERFAADWKRHQPKAPNKPIPCNGHKVAVIGSGPAGLTCAGDLAKMGYRVTVFEALHLAGGVLVYGIPEFRLPKKEVVEYEVQNIINLGVEINTDVIVGKTVSIDTLLEEEGFDAVFVASGAGLPNFMNIPGENLNGVVSSNEFLTRNNLMKSYHKQFHTPNFVGKKVAVVGGGNVAMDAARTAIRLGSHVEIIYRRSEQELPARIEEVHHAKEEGLIFNMLTNPVEILGNEKGWVSAMRCRRMALGEPDASGRRSPKEIPDSDFILDVDMVIMSIGTSPNPLIAATTPHLDTSNRGTIVADDNGTTSRKGVFAGGDAVSGAATVILAMGAGRKAAKAIDAYIQGEK